MKPNPLHLGLDDLSLLRGYSELAQNPFFLAINDGLRDAATRAINRVVGQDWTINDLPTLFQLIGEVRAYKRPMQLLESELRHLSEVLEQQNKKANETETEHPIGPESAE